MTGCTQKSEEQLHVAAAASLSPVFTELSRLYEEETGEQILLSFSSTGALTEQIRNGAPFDVFASADREHLDQLVSEGYLQKRSQTLFAFGSLILLLSPDYKGSINSLSDLQQADVRRIAIANPEIAPYGKAARQVLLDANLWEVLNQKIILGETVQQAFTFVISGNAEAGIVARSVLPAETTAIRFTQLASQETPEHWAAILGRSAHIPQAETFLNFLQSPAAVEVFKLYGFLPAEILQ